MCGIVAGAGRGDLLPFLLHGLDVLEYRGYDSAGAALWTQDGIRTVKTAGHVRQLRALLEQTPRFFGAVGIAHTRWATHGAPCTENAHPHTSMHGAYTVVHNGILENYRALRDTLCAAGFSFRSDTDTEVFANLLESLDTGDALQTIRLACRKLRGSFAFCVLCASSPDAVYCARRGSPLLIARTADGTFAASDRLALPAESETYRMDDDEFAVCTADDVRFFDAHGRERHKSSAPTTETHAAADKGVFETYMEKEIYEQPQAVAQTLRENVDLPPEKPERVYLIGCGSAYHAACVAAYLWEDALGVPCIPVLASEFRYRSVAVGRRSLAVAISQSGETADTLAALRKANALGVPTLSVLNSPGSTMDTESGRVLYTRAGREIAVATTKAYTAQLAALVLCQQHFRPEEAISGALETLPETMRACLALSAQAEDAARKYDSENAAYFIGRQTDFATAMEGALKLRETAYMDAHAYAAGELKHGTISLVREGTLCVAVCCDERIAEKTIANVEEVRARGAKVLCVTTRSLRSKVPADDLLVIPDAPTAVLPILSIVPLQFFAYFCAKLRKCAIDQPRNLAKSVTVE